MIGLEIFLTMLLTLLPVALGWVSLEITYNKKCEVIDSHSMNAGKKI